MRGMNNSVDTISAAASAIVTSESRAQQATHVQKRRWSSCWSLYWCFGSHRHTKRIGHAVLAPESTLSGPGGSDASSSHSHQSSIVLPFIAPPSSPASFLQSEPPSANHSPAGAGMLSLTAFSASVYSPEGPRSIFAIGPYAHETQLVSPPVFSTFTTEPSTAPLTPPPEPLQFTTPPSPEVPFARLLSSSLDPNSKSKDASRQFPSFQYEFQSYQLYPGSPVNHLISPRSVMSGSGTSSPFPDMEFTSSNNSLLKLSTSVAPKLRNIEGLSFRGTISPQGSSTPPASDSTKPVVGYDNMPLEDQISALASLANSENGSANEEVVVDHRVSFELTAEEVASWPAKNMEFEGESLSDVQSGSPVASIDGDGLPPRVENTAESQIHGPPEISSEEVAAVANERCLHPSLGGSKDFNFVNADGTSVGSVDDSDWWTSDKAIRAQPESRGKWAFFPMIQSGTVN